MSLGQKIKELRLERHWSQEKLAILSGVSRSYISELEQGKTSQVAAEVLYKLARGFEIELQVLLNAAGFRTPNPNTDKPISNAINDPELRQCFTFQNLNNLSATTRKVMVLLVQAEMEKYSKLTNNCPNCQGSQPGSGREPV